MSDGYEATFVVDVTRDVAWKRLTASDERLPGWEIPIEDVESVEGLSLRGRKAGEPCKGTEITVVLADEGSGTRVTITQTGFPSWFDVDLDAHVMGWEHIVADLALELASGVPGLRHPRPWAAFGATTRRVPAGLEIESVQGGCAAALQLVPGDVLLTVGGAPIVIDRELQTVLHVFRTGDEVKVAWIRGGSRMSGTASL
jgi:hypothetical protein